jgi:hypothetical protein
VTKSKWWGRLAGALWYVGVGFAPLWVAIAVVYYGSLSASASSEYWASAPWLIIIAAPFCVLSLVVVALTTAVHARTQGSKGRRFRVAALCFVVLAPLSAALGWWPWHHNNAIKKTLSAEAEQGIDYVKQHPLLKTVWAGPIVVGVHMSTQPSDPKIAREITYYAYPAEDITAGRMVIVEATHPTDEVRFRLRCIVTQFAFQNHEEPGDPCHPRFSESHAPPSDHEVILAEGE